MSAKLGHEARQPVVEQHERDDQEDADRPGDEALGEELLTQRRADLLGGDLLDRERQRAELEDRHELVGLGGREAPDAAGRDLDLPLGMGSLMTAAPR